MTMSTVESTKDQDQRSRRMVLVFVILLAFGVLAAPCIVLGVAAIFETFTAGIVPLG